MVSFPPRPGETHAVPSTSRTGAREGFPGMGSAGTSRHCCGPQGAAQRRPRPPVIREEIWATWCRQEQVHSQDSGPAPQQAQYCPSAGRTEGAEMEDAGAAVSSHKRSHTARQHCGHPEETERPWPAPRSAGRKALHGACDRSSELQPRERVGRYREEASSSFLRPPLRGRRGERQRRRRRASLPLPLAAVAVRHGEQGERLRSAAGRSPGGGWRVPHRAG